MRATIKPNPKMKNDSRFPQPKREREEDLLLPPPPSSYLVMNEDEAIQEITCSTRCHVAITAGFFM